jgi:hypothetical protein
MVAPAFAQIAGQIESTSDVVVKRGGEYYVAQDLSLLAEGDCVVSLEETAKIELINGCEFDLDANQSVIINATTESCDASFSPSEGVCAASDFESQDLQLGLLPLLIGAAAVTVTAIAIADDDDDDQPTSP